MKRHFVTVQDGEFDSIVAGQKRSVVCKNSGDFQAGDAVVFERKSDRLTCGDFEILHVCYENLGLIKGFVVLSLKPHEERKGKS